MPKSLRNLCVAALLSQTSAVRVDEDVEDTKTSDGLEADRRMLSWAIQGGIKGAEHLEFKRFPKGADNFMVRGVAATKDYKKGDTVIEVPANMLLWSEGKNTMQHLADLGVPAQLLQQDCGGLESNDCQRIRLAASLLETRDAKEDAKDAPHWGPYVKQLPSWKQFWTYHPVAAEENLLKAFDKLPLTSTLRKTQAIVDRRYDLYKKIGGTHNKEDFKWANLVVHAYSWGMPFGNNSCLLVPIGDSFNTAPKEQQNVQESVGNPDEGGSFTFKATRDIPAGSEILDMYQDTNDDSFVRSWGFPLKGAQQDMLTSAECNELKSNIGNAVQTPTGHCEAPSNQPQSIAFCSFARLALEHCHQL